MVVRVKEPDVALLYQTTPVCKAKDFFEGTLKNGVQINVLSEAVNGCNILRVLRCAYPGSPA
jgi:hypothetical protein